MEEDNFFGYISRNIEFTKKTVYPLTIQMSDKLNDSIEIEKTHKSLKRSLKNSNLREGALTNYYLSLNLFVFIICLSLIK